MNKAKLKYKLQQKCAERSNVISKILGEQQMASATSMCNRAMGQRWWATLVVHGWDAIGGKRSSSRDDWAQAAVSAMHNYNHMRITTLAIGIVHNQNFVNIWLLRILVAERMAGARFGRLLCARIVPVSTTFLLPVFARHSSPPNRIYI